MGNLILEEESFKIRGAVFEVYREMGCGFLESVYQECLEREFTRAKIPFVSQPEVTIRYRGETLKQTLRPDFICFDAIIVEIKALSGLVGEHRAQVLNYLKATQYKLGLLINFGQHPKAEIERIVL